MRVILERAAEAIGVFLLLHTIIWMFFDRGPIHESSVSGLPNGGWNLIIVVILLFLAKFLYS